MYFSIGVFVIKAKAFHHTLNPEKTKRPLCSCLAATVFEDVIRMFEPFFGEITRSIEITDIDVRRYAQLLRP